MYINQNLKSKNFMEKNTFIYFEKSRFPDTKSSLNHLLLVHLYCTALNICSLDNPPCFRILYYNSSTLSLHEVDHFSTCFLQKPNLYPAKSCWMDNLDGCLSPPLWPIVSVFLMFSWRNLNHLSRKKKCCSLNFRGS